MKRLRSVQSEHLGGTAAIQAIRLEGRGKRPPLALALARRGVVVYSVATVAEGAGSGSAPSAEHRANGRNRLRLRWAKIISPQGRFLGEGRLHDRSAGGARLALAALHALPGKFWLHDDASGETEWVVVVWRRGAQIGLRLGAPGAPPPLKPSDRFALRQRYSGVADR